jgi:putative Mg2+ transporter-C (MgtC) family protein
MLYDLSAATVCRLLLAALLGGIIGLERELRHKPSGLRTNMLISLGSALFTIISYQLAGDVGGDHTRIAAQIIPGIGFIGAGVVLRERGTIVGITSAATIFVMASVGMACGSGMPVTAIFTTLMLLVVLVLLGMAETQFGLQGRLMTFCLTTPGDSGVIEQAHQMLRESGIETRRWQTHKTPEGFVVEFDADVTAPQERDLLTKLGATRGRCEARPVH